MCRRTGTFGAFLQLSQKRQYSNHCRIGAKDRPDLRIPRLAIYVDKATDPVRENFSDFSGTALGEQLRRKGIQRLFVGGLALDYCVRATVLEGLTEGFEVHLLLSATRAVNVKEGDGQRALDELRSAGAVIEDGAA